MRHSVFPLYLFPKILQNTLFEPTIIRVYKIERGKHKINTEQICIMKMLDPGLTLEIKIKFKHCFSMKASHRYLYSYRKLKILLLKCKSKAEVVHRSYDLGCIYPEHSCFKNPMIK